MPHQVDAKFNSLLSGKGWGSSPHRELVVVMMMDWMVNSYINKHHMKVVHFVLKFHFTMG